MLRVKDNLPKEGIPLCASTCKVRGESVADVDELVVLYEGGRYAIVSTQRPLQKVKNRMDSALTYIVWQRESLLGLK